MTLKEFQHTFVKDEHCLITYDKWMAYQAWIDISNQVSIKRFWQFTNRNCHKWN